MDYYPCFNQVWMDISFEGLPSEVEIMQKGLPDSLFTTFQNLSPENPQPQSLIDPKPFLDKPETYLVPYHHYENFSTASSLSSEPSDEEKEPSPKKLRKMEPRAFSAGMSSPSFSQPLSSPSETRKPSKKNSTSVSKVYGGMISVGFGNFMKDQLKDQLKMFDGSQGNNSSCEREKPQEKSPFEENLDYVVNFVEKRICGRDNPNLYKLLKPKDVCQFFLPNSKDDEKEADCRQYLGMWFREFLTKDHWKNWLKEKFGGNEESKVWIAVNIEEIRRNLLDLNYRARFKKIDPDEDCRGLVKTLLT